MDDGLCGEYGEGEGCEDMRRRGWVMGLKIVEFVLNKTLIGFISPCYASSQSEPLHDISAGLAAD